jgi:hypothetical protein
LKPRSKNNAASRIGQCGDVRYLLLRSGHGTGETDAKSDVIRSVFRLRVTCDTRVVTSYITFLATPELLCKPRMGTL